MKAFDHLQASIIQSGLSINYKKSSLIYFHEQSHPLSDNVMSSIEQIGISYIKNRTVILGAVIGANVAEIAAGVRELVPDLHADPFFSRLTKPHLGVQSAMLLLRYCGIPKMSYLLRVTPPEAIKDIAADFDRETIHIAYRLLDLEGDKDAYDEDIIEQLRAPLRLGGFGITSAAASSHAAYLSSVASAAAVAALHRYARADQSLPDDCILYSQLTECLTTIINTTPSCADDLPASASTFFSHYHSTESSAPISGLQSTLNTRATQHLFDAAVHRAEVVEILTLLLV